jgi:hypothetical protein
MNEDSIHAFIESIDLKLCVFCGSPLLIKGRSLPIKGLPDVNPFSGKISPKTEDVMIPIGCPKCGFVHFFSGDIVETLVKHSLTSQKVV